MKGDRSRVSRAGRKRVLCEKTPWQVEEVSVMTVCTDPRERTVAMRINGHLLYIERNFEDTISQLNKGDLDEVKSQMFL